MSTTKNKSQVLRVWEDFILKVDAWGTDKQPVMVAWKGGVDRSMETLEPAIAELMAELQDGQVFERDAWETVLAIDDFLAEVVAWAQSVKDDWQNTNPAGHKELWDAFHQVSKAATENLPDKIETVAQLLSLPNMPAQQVARMYGWFDELGNPDVNKVEDEKLNPGRHTANWVNPTKLARDKRVEEAWAKRCETFGGWDTGIFMPDAEAPSQRKEEPAKEPLEELLSYPGMTFDQAAKMKHMTMDEVREAAKEIALANPMVAQLVSVDTAMGRMSVNHDLRSARNMLAAAVVDSYPELDTVERIYAMADDGIRPGRILAALRATHCAIDYDQVVSILNRRGTQNATTETTDEERTEAGVVAGISDEAESEQAGEKTSSRRGRPSKKPAASV